MDEQKQNNNPTEITLNEKGMEVLVAKFIPTSQYFERSFEILQRQIDGLRDGQKDLKDDIGRRFVQMENRFEQVDRQINELRDGQKDFKNDMDKRFGVVDKRFEQVEKRFEQVDKRFEQVDKRFEQVDKRFEQVDKRFDQVNVKLDTIIERLDVKIDAGLRENRAMSIRLFSFAMVFSAISMAGLLAKMTGLF